jgi:hypothetical protein
VGAPHQGRLNYKKRLKEMEMTAEGTAMATTSTEPTKDIVQSTRTFLAPGRKLPMRQQILV